MGDHDRHTTTLATARLITASDDGIVMSDT
jgi:hypothetical protein